VRHFEKPRVVVSRCLEFTPCRYNGQVVPDAFVRRLMGQVMFCPVCPEMEIGLGVPRDPIRVVAAGGERRLVQPSTGRDVSDAMRQFAGAFLGALGEVDGFLLRARSPSCGIKDVKVYGAADAEVPSGKAAGFFGGAVLERFADRAVEDEGRLNSFAIREHFLSRLFTLADFRRAKAAGGMGDLVAFHGRTKWLLMAYSEAALRALGRIVANPARRPAAEVFAAYGPRLAKALARPPRPTAILNVLMHALGHVSDGLSAPEKAMFLGVLAKYRCAAVPLSAPAAILRAWGIRFQAANLLAQTFLEPYPESLLEITDSGKGRGA
jgi:uncharacterized protein YbgA (DUF1722 family)/uncharacterized protein YbbK (DUF523 family)